MKRKFILGPASEPYLLPPSVDDWLPEDHLARFLEEVVSGLDLTSFYEDYEERVGRGRPPYDPAMMLRVMIYCYLTGRFSSRKIETATYDDVAVRYLTRELHPDHDCFAEFRKRHISRFSDVAVQVVQVAVEVGLVKLGHLSLDGTKLKAAASRRSTFSVAKLAKAIEEEKERIDALLTRAAEEDAKEELDEKRLPLELARRERRLEKLQRAQALVDEQLKSIKEAAAAAAVEAAAAAATQESSPPPQEYTGPGRVRQTRLQRGLTQSRLGELTGMKRSRIDAIERDLCVPSQDEVQRLAVALELEGSELQFREKFIAEKKTKPDTAAEAAVPNHVNITDPDSRLLATREGRSYIQGYNPQVVVDQAFGFIVAAHMSNDANDAANVAPALDQVMANMGRMPETFTADSAYFSVANVADPRFEGVEVLIPPKLKKMDCKNPHPVAQAMREKLAIEDMRSVYNQRSAIVEPTFARIKCVTGFTRFLMRGFDKVGGEWQLVTMAHNVMRLFSWFRRG